MSDFTFSKLPPQESGQRWRLVLLLMLAVAAGHFNRISMSVAGTERLIPGYGIDPTQMGWVYTAFLIVYTLFMTPGGWFIDRFGPKLAFMVVLFGSALFMSFTGLSGMLFVAPASIWVALLVVRSLMGLVNVPLHPAAARLVGNWVTPSGRNLVNGLVTCAAPLGISVTYLLFGWLIDTFDWTGASLCASGGTLLLASIWTFAASDKPKGSTTPKTENQATAAGSCKLLLQHRSLIFLTLSYALVSYFQYLFFYWAQFYFEKVRNLPKDTSRLYSTMLSLAMGFGMVMGGWLSDAFRARSMNRRTWTIVPVASLLFAAVAVVPGILSEETWITLACFSIAMFAVGASEGSFWTLAVELGGKRGGTAAGILNTGGNAGGLIAPVITPYISALFGWQAGLGLASVVCILGALCWVGIDPNECMADSTEPQIEDC